MLIRRTALATVASVVLFGPTQVVHAQFDIEGIWTPLRDGEEGRRAGQPPLEDVRLTPAGQAEFDNFGADNDPSFRCIAPGVPRGLVDPYPREIIEQDHQIVVLHEYYHQVRRIFMDGREAPDYWPASLGGYSTGQWDGDTLVVRTTHLSPDNDMWVSGLPFSGDENTYVIERYTRSDDVLSMVAEISDPAFYEETYVMKSRWTFTTDGEIWDYECNPDFGAVD